MAFVLAEKVQQVQQQRKPAYLDDYAKLLFTKYEYVLEPTTSKLSIPLHTVTMDKIVEHMKVSYEKVAVSRFGAQHLLSANEVSTLFPRWTYREVEGAPTVGDVVQRLIDTLKGHSFYTIANKIEEFTSQPNTAFRVADQLLQAVEKATKVKVTYLANQAGGVDIIAGVESASEAGKLYGVAIYVGSVDGKPETTVPTINFACNCPVGRSSSTVMCKHVLAVLCASPHIVFGAVDYIASGRSNKLEHYVDYWKDRFSKLFSSTNTDAERTAYAYYLAKFLYSKGLLRKVPADSVLDELASAISTGNVDGWLKEKYISVQEVATEIKTHELAETGNMVKIKWTPEMERIRGKIEAIIRDLTHRFGTLDDRGEWQTLLVFGTAMSSIISPTRPPIVLHAVGDIGTFKTTGARLIAQYFELPVLVVSYRGGGVAEKYRELVNTISRYFGIPVPEIENKVGGVIPHLQTYKDGFTASLSLQYLYSYALSVENPALVQQFIDELTRLGFSVEVRTVKPKTVVLDPAQLSNIDDYRMKYIPDENLGIITQMDVFDNYIVVIDEGCRNLHGLETLLTKMSISTTNEGVRLLIVTDNLDPFMESVRNPRYGPFHDRTFKAITRSIRDEGIVGEHLHKVSEERLSVLELMAAQRFIENIPVMPGFVTLAKAVAYALTYKYTIPIVKKGVKHLRPMSRDEKAEIELDAFAGSNFKFIAGNRFVHHTLTLAKFFAFLNKHDYVTLDDFMSALTVTVKSRLVVDANTARNYKITVVDVISNLYKILSFADVYLSRVQKFAGLLNGGDAQEISKEFDELIKEGNQEPFVLSLVSAALEQMMSMNKIRLDKLPDNVKYTLIEMKIEKDDIMGLEPVMSIINEIRQSELKEVKNEVRK